jgi:carbamoyltransferase
MGMSAWGKPSWYPAMAQQVIEDFEQIRFKDNLHTGFDQSFLEAATDEDIACAAQLVIEELIQNVMYRAQQIGWSDNLVYMGGVALNCLANRHLGKYFENIWIMPAPGDAGSSLGAAALAYGQRINWSNAFLGHDIPGPYPTSDLLDCLLRDKIVGVASGRAEFGPRALGNRSLLADPRGPEIKDQVNEIKRRQKFRPFAPVILEERADMYFDMPRGFDNSRYMQVIARCRHPHIFPAICHVDNTSRVQTVPRDGSGIRLLLEAWYAETGCPMLLNTSLNIRGEPMVNDRADAERFYLRYGVPVFS